MDLTMHRPVQYRSRSEQYLVCEWYTVEWMGVDSLTSSAMDSSALLLFSQRSRYIAVSFSNFFIFFAIYN